VNRNKENLAGTNVHANTGACKKRKIDQGLATQQKILAQRMDSLPDFTITNDIVQSALQTQ
jgi:hypothetical protein